MTQDCKRNLPPSLRKFLTATTVFFPLLAHAQAPATPATPEACLSIENDPERLTCYDAALGRTARDTRRADIAAKAARAIQQNLELADQVQPESESAAPTQ